MKKEVPDYRRTPHHEVDVDRSGQVTSYHWMGLTGGVGETRTHVWVERIKGYGYTIEVFDPETDNAPVSVAGMASSCPVRFSELPSTLRKMLNQAYPELADFLPERLPALFRMRKATKAKVGLLFGGHLICYRRY